MKSRATIKKKSIIWYWDKKLEEWRKGKVVAVNRWYLTVKKRNGEIFNLTCWAYPASGPKPTLPPKSYQELDKQREMFWDDGHIKAYGPSFHKAKFLLKMGIVRFN